MTTEAATQTASTLAGTPAARNVLAAALQDATAVEGGELDRGPQAAAPVAAVEEGLLRLLVLQKQLHVAEDPENVGHRAALADAAAGLVPRMLQVLEVARGVCEANRTKLTSFCQERDMDLDRLAGEGPGAYLQNQLTALDKLRSQYSSLLPSAAAPQLSDDLFSRGMVFQPGSRSATPGRSGPQGGGASAMGTWPDSTAFSVSGPLPGSPPPRLHASPKPFASHASHASHISIGPALHDPSSMTRGGAALDPGGQGPQVPLLRGGGGGSSPPPAKFREGRPQASSPALLAPHVGASDQNPMWSGAAANVESHARASRSPRSDHNVMWNGVAANIETNAAANAMWNGVGANVETNAAANAMWNATASAALAGPQSEFAPSGTSTPRRAASPVPRSERDARPELPLRLLALQQIRDAADSAAAPTRRPPSRQRSATASRSTAGGAHAAAGSPSPEREHVGREDVAKPATGKAVASSSSLSRASSRGRGAEPPAAQQPEERAAGPGRSLAGPPEDKYFKILQSLQAKGAVGGRAKLLEGVGLAARDRKENRAQALGDSAALSRPWTPATRSPATVSGRGFGSGPIRRRRLAADSESDDSLERS